MRRRFLALAGVGLLLAGVTACDFRPLYGTTQQGAVGDDLQTVRIAPLPDRTGQILHNYLRDGINPYGQPTAPLYELRIGLSETVDDSGIRQDETASREVLTMRARIQLVDLRANAPVYESLARSSSAYNVLNNPFPSIVSADNARERVLRELADDIKLRLAAYFASQR